MIHILDWVLYFIILFLIYKILGDEYTQELGGVVGCMVVIVYTIIYSVAFYYYDVMDIINWLFENIVL